MRSAEKKPLKVVFYEPLGGGGICHYTYLLANSLTNHGAEVVVYTADVYELRDMRREFRLKYYNESRFKKGIYGIFNSDRSRKRAHQERGGHSGSGVDGGKIPNSMYGRIRSILLTVELAFSLWAEKPTAIHIQWLMNPRRDRYLVRFLKLLRMNVCYTAHDLFPHGRSLKEKKYYRELYRLFDTIVVHTRANRNEIERDFGVHPDGVSLIPLGSLNLSPPNPRVDSALMRRKLEIPAGKKVILFFGYIRKYKGLQHLLLAYKDVVKDVPDTLLVVAGKFHDEEKDCLFYRRVVESLGLDEHVVFFDGYVPHDEASSYFMISDIVVLPYLRTYHSGVLLLAYSFGKPVIATDTGGLREVVEEGASGLLVPPGDTTRLAQAMVSLLRDNAKREEMGRYAKKLSDVRYNWDLIAEKTMKMYGG